MTATDAKRKLDMPRPMVKGEVVPWDEPSSVVAAPIEQLVPLAQVREALLTGARPEPVDPDTIAEAIGQRLLAMTDLDALMDPEAWNTQEKIIAEPMWLRGALFMPSDIEESKVPVYCVLDFVTSIGEPRMFSCGGRGVVIQVLTLLERNALPRLVKLIEVGTQKGSRNRPLYLQDVHR